MSKRTLAVALAAVALLALAVAHARSGALPAPGSWREAGRPPRIHPDYADVVLPPNIAPLNFAVDEPGRRWAARLTGASRRIEVASSDGTIRFPQKAWHALAAASAGGELRCDVYVQEPGGRWTHFDTIRNRVAREEVDGTLVYRLLGPIYNMWYDLGIYQRDLGSFAEKPILQNRSIHGACLNCHTFACNQPDKFFFHLRGGKEGPLMVIADHGHAYRVDTRTSLNDRPATYSAWHPSGKLIAFSYNNIIQFFHTVGREPRDVVDLDSGIAVCWLDTKKVTSALAINQPRRLETFPAWSPKGDALYFCAAAMPWPEPKPIPYQDVARVRYDLVRVGFDVKTGAWGRPETIISAKEMGKSLLEPRVSPDGRFLAFTACDYGAFPIHQEHSDLWLVDLKGKGFPRRKLDAAPETQRDSWHSWSSNGRWLVFSRKGDNGLVARPFLRYIDADGNPAKALMVPQEDPTYCDRALKTYNVPELLARPVTIPAAELARAINSGELVKAWSDPTRPAAGNGSPAWR